MWRFLLLFSVGCASVVTPDTAPMPDAGSATPGPACYADDQCSVGTCRRSSTIPPTVQWNDATDVSWAPADVVAGYATLYNNHVDLRLQFRETPFDPSRSQTLRVCFDTDEDVATGTACGLPGADIAFTFEDGELVEKGPIDDPCITNAYDAETKTLEVKFERYGFPNGALEQQFRYVVLSSFVNEHGETVTDSVPDDPDFSRSGGSKESESSFSLWPKAGKCCRFRAGECVGGSCRRE